MKNTFNILILLFFTISALGQEIKYTLFIKNPCTEIIEKSCDYYLEKEGIEYCPTSLDSTTILLPTLGEYKLIASEIGEIHKIKINRKINSDTLIMSRIQEYIVTHDRHGYRFEHCDRACDGIETGYYSDGSIQLIAKFKKGLVIGELKRFYLNGKIKEISNYNKQGYFTNKTRFDENGKIIKE